MLKRTWASYRDPLVLLLLLVLGLVFFLANVSPRLADDDLAWLRGEAPTVFDQYRQVPRLFFVSLHALLGPSAVAALSLIFGFHALNALLVHRLARRLLADRLAALVAVAVFLINPLTLNTLTWISCFSYVIGTTLALLALLAFWQAVSPSPRGGERRGEGEATPGASSAPSPTDRLRSAPSPLGGRGSASALALLCFGLGLFSTHEIFFLPVAFLALGWQRGALRRGAVLCAAGLALALLVNALVYDFGRYGVEAARLFSADFALAYASSALSSGLALALAYPLSFFVKPLAFLRLSFTEPLRWGMTVLLLAVAAFFYRADRAGRLALALALSCLALITPYIIRLYLTPDSVNYHIAYALSGRVFYLPFTVLALALGWFVAWLWRPVQGRRGAWAALLLPLVAYGHALWLYEPVDFLGLNVAHEMPQPMPPRWNPYAAQQPLWFWVSALALLLLIACRLLARKRPHPNAAS